jgi:hypothetical protein
MSDCSRFHAGRSRSACQLVQLTTDGHKAYLAAVEDAFGSDVDFAQVIKLYGETPHPPGRYSPAECIGAQPQRIEGCPDPKLICTSYVEGNNPTMRMSMRRFTRLTNGFSRKLEANATRWRCSTCSTTSAVSTRRFAARLQWPLASRTACAR